MNLGRQLFGCMRKMRKGLRVGGASTLLTTAFALGADTRRKTHDLTRNRI